MNSDSRVRRVATALLLGLALLPVLSYAWLGQYARPLLDEYRFTELYANMPFWEAFQLGLTSDHSNGYGYLTSRILWIPLGFTASEVFPALILATLASCISALLYQALDVVGLVGNRRLAAVAVGGLLLGAVCASPQSLPTLYYYEAAQKYITPIAPLILFMLLLLHVARQPRIQGRRLWLYALLGWLLCFVAVGFSETFAIVIVLGLGLLLVLTLLAGREWRRCLLVMASGCSATVVGILLLLSTPGLRDRIFRRLARPNIADRSLEDILAQAMQSWLDYIGDPAALASIALMVAVGILVGLKLPSEKPNAGPGRAARLPQFFALVSQLLLLPLVWQHQSDQPIFFGRFSAGYFTIIVINMLLICGAALLLWRHRRVASGHGAGASSVAIVGLAGILLCWMPTQVQEAMHWRAYLYLWLSAHSLLILLGWHVSRWLSACVARRFAIGLGCLYFLILTGAAVVAVSTNIFSEKDIPRASTFLAHLFAWLGLVWGVGLGWALRSALGPCKWLAAGALLMIGGLTAPIVIENMQMLPRWRQYAAEFDDRFATIIAGRAQGQRDYVFAPFSFDLASHMGVGSMHEDAYLLETFDIGSITLEET